MKDPAFLFYPSDFYIKTLGWDKADIGDFITLMCLQHLKGHLPEQMVKEVSDVVRAEFVKDEDGLFYNKFLDEVIEKRKNWTESRRRNGKKGGRPKQEKLSTEKNHMVNHVVKHMGNENENVIDYVNLNNISNNSLLEMRKKRDSVNALWRLENPEAWEKGKA